MRAVLETNILVSAMITSSGTPAAIVKRLGNSHQRSLFTGDNQLEPLKRGTLRQHETEMKSEASWKPIRWKPTLPKSLWTGVPSVHGEGP